VTERNDSHPNTGAAQAGTEAERLRTQARRALILARDVTDQEAARALKVHAADLLARSEAIERQGEN
jgi:hypothetical protein